MKTLTWDNSSNIYVMTTKYLLGAEVSSFISSDKEKQLRHLYASEVATNVRLLNRLRFHTFRSYCVSDLEYLMDLALPVVSRCSYLRVVYLAMNEFYSYPDVVRKRQALLCLLAGAVRCIMDTNKTLYPRIIPKHMVRYLMGVHNKIPYKYVSMEDRDLIQELYPGVYSKFGVCDMLSWATDKDLFEFLYDKCGEQITWPTTLYQHVLLPVEDNAVVVISGDSLEPCMFYHLIRSTLLFNHIKAVRLVVLLGRSERIKWECVRDQICPSLEIYDSHSSWREELTQCATSISQSNPEAEIVVVSGNGDTMCLFDLELPNPLKFVLIPGKTSDHFRHYLKSGGFDPVWVDFSLYARARFDFNKIYLTHMGRKAGLDVEFSEERWCSFLKSLNWKRASSSAKAAHNYFLRLKEKNVK